MRLVDVHAHMDLEPITSKLDQVLVNAKNNDVKLIVANGTSPQSNRAVLDLAQKHAIIRPALGLYPNDTHNLSEQEVDQELEFIQKSKAIALGEVGLDQKWSEEDKPQKDLLFKKQTQAFEKVIALSEKTKKPLIIHSRKAEGEVIDMLESSNAKRVIMHCFMGKKKFVKKVIDNGWSLSIPLIIDRLQQLKDNVQDTPLSQLFTETDSPYLGHTPGLTNEPANIKYIIKEIAKIKKLNEEETADQLFLNYQRMFSN